ncbi:septation ring formation regulator EzrA [Knoellia sinensis KCTC 19936]|uniref:Septation ring formation regulator EzrA n=1 Tax=Knoellia sinensis KCTC 19936 TaxID=1385520 RepID=A0A0A0J624_9MICO|nr:septum formation initiator family protein [Knoellia sinensis]KGN32815.1 septation ring formation regulator EzrA [Knoellia sinensis KCTC 19936]
MARGSGRGPGSSSRRPGSSRPSTRARAGRQPALGKAAAQAAEAAASTWRGRLDAVTANRQNVRRVTLGVLLLFLVVLVGPTLKAYLQQRSDISALRDKVAQQRVTVDELQAEQARWEDPAYVEQQARTQLKFVKVGEKSYTVLDPKQRDTSGSIAHRTDTVEPWYDTVWSSMQAADVPANHRR